MVRLAVADSIGLMIVVEEVGLVDMAAVAAMMTTTVDLLAMRTASVAHMDVVMTMDLEALIGMPQVVVMIVIAVVVMNIVVEVTPTVGTVDDLEATAAMQRQEKPASLTVVETETKNIALRIGTPAVECGPLIYIGAECFIKRTRLHLLTFLASF